MRVNSNHIIRGSTVTLVPYLPHHVPTYHKWMLDPFLLEMTASEPLSLAEEHEMQLSWARDETKLTFIILSTQMDGKANDSPELEAERLGGMVGDVNLYFNDFEDAMGMPEIECMIAEPGMRRKGAGEEALRLIMNYSVQKIPSIHTFVAKIGLKNLASRSLFTQKLGFKEIKIVEAFEEVTMEKAVTKNDFDGIPLVIEDYDAAVKQ
ncbi:hypothetical protein HDU98_002792 [Podochytrium sp. JEL0797]|nr:hypothetical protein HDU98_002792 [Podochytrium sp. JEL0797]